MKPHALLIITTFLNYYSSGQNTFTINIEEPLTNYISDVIENTGQYYFIQNRIRDHNPLVDNSSICDLLITDLTTSTDGPDHQLISISAFPNPGLNNLTFSVNGFDASSLHKELINEMGQVLFKKQDLSYSIQVPELPAEQYFYRILQNEKLLGVGSWVKQ